MYRGEVTQVLNSAVWWNVQRVLLLYMCEKRTYLADGFAFLAELGLPRARSVVALLGPGSASSLSSSSSPLMASMSSALCKCAVVVARSTSVMVECKERKKSLRIYGII